MIHDYSGLTVWRIETVKRAHALRYPGLCLLNYQILLMFATNEHLSLFAEFISGKITNFTQIFYFI